MKTYRRLESCVVERGKLANEPFSKWANQQMGKLVMTNQTATLCPLPFAPISQNIPSPIDLADRQGAPRRRIVEVDISPGAVLRHSSSDGEVCASEGTERLFGDIEEAIGAVDDDLVAVSIHGVSGQVFLQKVLVEIDHAFSAQSSHRKSPPSDVSGTPRQYLS